MVEMNCEILAGRLGFEPRQSAAFIRRAPQRYAAAPSRPVRAIRRSRPLTPPLLSFFRLSKMLAGRLGFEPRQSAPKALDLPLVDRPKILYPGAHSVCA